jgi:hypothetical protein
VAVVSISFPGGGRPEAGLSNRGILHLAPVASRKDITLMKASLSNDCRPTCAAPGETLVRSSIPDDGGTVVSFSLLGASFVKQHRWT